MVTRIVISIYDIVLATGIETLLCFMELDDLIKVYLPTETTCKIYCYGGAQQLALAAKKCPPLAVALQCKGIIWYSHASRIVYA